MRIREIQLENIRSHVESIITFEEGFNCIVGGLGCGKSSVLYAIDFALIGDPLGRSYDYLLREGADKGKITLRFIHGGKAYTISRTLQRQDSNISQDMDQLKFLEKEKLIAGTRNEAVTEQLKAITGLDKDLFREIVWVRQEHLKELLDVTPRQRQRQLDELFGLSDYEDAWNNLARSQRDYEIERDVRERDQDVIGLERFQTDYDRAVTDFASVEAEIGNLEMKFTQAQSALKDADERLKSLEELRKKTEELGRKEAHLRANLVNLEDTCAALANQIEQKKKSIDALEERLRLMDAQEKTHRNRLSEVGLDPNQTLEELKKQSEALGEQMAILRGEQESNRRETTSSRHRISSLATENKCPLCLQALSEGYKTGLLERLHIENIEREKKQAELQRNLEDLEALRKAVSLVDSNLRLITPRREEVKTRIASEYDSLNSFSDEFKKKQQEEMTFRGELEAARAKVAEFDVTELQAARRFRDKAFFEHSEVRHTLEVMRTRKTDLSKRIDEIKNRLDQSQKKIERIEKIKRLLQIVEGIRRAYRSIQPRLRSEFIAYLERTVQQVLNGLLSTAGPLLTVKIDETYTPIVKSEDGHEREASHISGGERTLLAFAYRLGLGQLIMQSRTGHGLFMLFLDEPTESLGTEDGSVDRLAEAISRLKAIEQIIAVTHSEAFAEKAEHVIRIDKEAGVSSVSFQQ